MKLTFLIAFVIGFSGATTAASIDDQIALVRFMANTERQAIVSANMGLTDEETDTFWPLYREYRKAMNQLGDRTVNLIRDYGENHENLSEKKARELTEEWLEIQADRISTQRKYARKFRRVVSEVKVARLIQIENKIDAVYRLEMSTQIPLAK